METPKVKVFSRSGEATDSPKPPETPEAQPSISWRKISLLGTPLLLGVINLIEAHWEKKTAYTNGEIRYTQLVGEGKEAERVAPEQGRIVGQQRKLGMIEEAKQHAKGLVEGAKNSADLEREVGDIKTPVIDMQAQKTLSMMKPQHDIMENILHITRLALMKNEGLVISVPSKLSETSFVGRGQKDFSDAELLSRIKAMGPLVEAAAVARSREALSVRGEAKFSGCR